MRRVAAATCRQRSTWQDARTLLTLTEYCACLALQFSSDSLPGWPCWPWVCCCLHPRCPAPSGPWNIRQKASGALSIRWATPTTLAIPAMLATMTRSMLAPIARCSAITRRCHGCQWCHLQRCPLLLARHPVRAPHHRIYGRWTSVRAAHRRPDPGASQETRNLRMNAAGASASVVFLRALSP